MSFTSEEVGLTTGSSPGVFDVSGSVAEFCHGKGDGLVSVFVPHATAGVALLEVGAGSDDDLLEAIDRILPADDRWRHVHGAPGHGRDHVVPAIVSPSLTIPVLDGRPALGTWQSVVVVDTNVDNHHRTVRLSFLG